MTSPSRSANRWHTEPRTCSHTNDDVCPMCDFDGYYAATYPDCPWREQPVCASAHHGVPVPVTNGTDRCDECWHDAYTEQESQR